MLTIIRLICFLAVSGTFNCVLAIASLSGCYYSLLDVSKYEYISFEPPYNIEGVADEATCLLACNADCTGIIWNEETRGCYILGLQNPPQNPNKIQFQTSHLRVLFREQFACGLQGQLQ